MATAAFFDLDKTIIAKSSVLAFGRPFYREGLLSKRAIVRSAYAQVVFMLVGADENKMEKLRVAMLDMIRGWDRDHVATIVREALEDVVTPIIFAEALELIAEHQAAGRKVVIVSSAPEEVVTPLGEFLGVDEVIATRAEVGMDGAYTGELSYYGYGPHKAEAIKELAEREGIDLSESFAYSDSVTDEPMLRAVGHPVVVNPDRELARIAREEGWPVRNFVRPVRLRDRVPVPPAPALAVTGAVAAAGAGVVVWWLLKKKERQAA
jgi:HAD superfamily hydrolase (TIGR01490 family)